MTVELMELKTTKGRCCCCGFKCSPLLLLLTKLSFAVVVVVELDRLTPVVISTLVVADDVRKLEVVSDVEVAGIGDEAGDGGKV